MSSRPTSSSRLLGPVLLGLGLGAALLLAAAAAAEDPKPPAPNADAVEGGEKLGMSEAQRKEVFIALADAEDRAEREAAQKSQGDPESDGQSALATRLLQRYRAEIAKAHGLGAEQIEEIQAEGFAKNWKVVLQ